VIARELRIPEVKLIESETFADERGWFFEEFQDERFAALGLPTAFPQQNRSRSRQGVLRGLHYQFARPQGKLVSCTQGRIFDVAVDVRRGSPTFGKWVGVNLDGASPHQLWIPPGFAHGFCVLSPVADVAYKLTDVYAAEDERGILWCDPDVGIEWPVSAPIVSERDRALKPLRDSVDVPEYTLSLR
jgi:dTDP-4-dehydrorhamnose 3,5-epimerase